MEAKKTRVTRLLLIITLALAFAAQYYFAKKRDYLWDGVVLYAIAGALFIRVIRALEPPVEMERRLTWGGVWAHIWSGAYRGSVLRLIVFVGGALLIALVAAAAGKRTAGDPEYDLLIVWLLGIALLLGALIDWRCAPDQLQAWGRRLQEIEPETLLILVLVGATLVTRGYDVAHIPFIIHGDEAAMGLEALDVIDGRRTSPFVTGWFGNPTLYFFVQAAFLRLLGVNVTALRLSSVLISGATALMLYLFARRYYGRWVAILAGLFYATYHYAIHYGRLAINNAWDPFFALSIFYFATRGIESRRLGDLIVAGLLLGLSIYFHAGARLIAVILVLYVAYWFLREREHFDEHNIANLVMLALIAFLVAMPLLRFFVTHYSDMVAPWTRKALFVSNGAAPSRFEMLKQTTGKSGLAIMVDQVLRSFLAFNYYHDPTFFYRPNMPLLHFIPALFFVLGLVYALANWHRRVYFLPVIWFALVLIFGSVLLENPPSSHRILLTIPPVALFVSLGVKQVLRYVGKLADQPPSSLVAISLVLMGFFGYQSLDFYFGTYTKEHMFTTVNDEVGNVLGKYLRVLGPDYQCYFFGPPRVYVNHPPIPFFSRGVTAVDVRYPIADNSGQLGVAINPQKDAVFVFLPERARELDIVRRYYPNGLLREFPSLKAKGQLLFVAYEVDLAN